jgi:predicted metal-dependent hydrolase
MHIKITRKPIKSLRMKITTDGAVLVSAPKWMSDKAIQSRIDSKNERIRTSLTKIEKKKPKI